jgi:hypothetical protein
MQMEFSFFDKRHYKTSILYIAALILMSLCVLLLSSCTKSTPGEDIENIFNQENLDEGENGIPSATAEYGFGLRYFFTNDTVEYNGEAILLPYFFENHGTTVAEAGLVILLDGIIQPFDVKVDGVEVASNVTMYTVTAGSREHLEFDVFVRPITGSTGDVLGLYHLFLNVPSFGPTNDSHPNYGNNHKAAMMGPMRVRMNESSTPSRELVFSEDYSVMAITEQMKEEYRGISDELNFLDTNTVYEISTSADFSELSFRLAGNGQIEIFMRVFGGDTMNYRTAVFINHKQVKVNNADYMEFTVEKGQVSYFSFILDLDPNERFSTFYTITAPIGQDFLKPYAFPNKTLSQLLVNENVEDSGE